MTYRVERSRYGVRVAPGALEGWRHGVASGKPRVRILGDSQSFGQIVSTPTNSWGDVWRSKLRDALVGWSKIGALAAEYHPCIYNAALATAVGYTYGGNAPWVQEVAPVSIGVPDREGATITLPYTWQLGLGGAATWAPTTDGQLLMSFNKTNWLPTFTDADIWVPNVTVASPPGKYSLDGGANTALTNVTAANSRMSVTNLSGMSNTSHKIEIKGSALQMWLDGIATWYAGRSGNGLQWASVGMPSGDLSNYSPTSWENWAGWDGTAYGNILFPNVPHLLIIAHGLNDSRRVSPGAFATRALNIIRTMRRAADIVYGQKMSVLFIVEDANDTATWNLAAGPGDAGLHGGTLWLQPTWQEWVRMLGYVADSVDGILCNWQAAEVGRPLAKGHLINNDVHLTVSGHQALADMLSNILIL